MNKRVILFWFALFSLLLTTLIPAVTRAEPVPLLISAVQITGGSGRTAEDFVELFNPNPEPVSLVGYQLVKRTAQGTTNTSITGFGEVSIPARSFFLWANSSFTGITTVPDTTSSATISDNNGVALLYGGAVVDSLAWGNSVNTFPVVSTENPGASQSLVRTNVVTNPAVFTIQSSAPRNSSVVFTDEEPDPPTDVPPEDPPADDPPPVDTPPTEDPPSEPPAPVIRTESTLITISEFLPNPAGSDSGNEKIELLNGDSERIQLSGWYLGDAGEVKSNSWQLPEQIIQPGEYLVLTIPKGKFGFNNSGGDRLVLFGNQKQMLQEVVFTESAPEGKTWAFIEAEWQWADPTWGITNQISEALKQYGTGLQISELFSNPVGFDEGHEWIELYNASQSVVELQGILLDTTLANNQKPSATAFRVNESVLLQPGDYYVVELPEDSITLGNSESNTVNVFNPSRYLITTTSFGVLEEGRSFIRSESTMNPGYPTPGKANISELPNWELTISEIYPAPADGDTEFIELFNPGTESVDLAEITLVIGERETKLPSVAIGPNSYAVITESELSVRLKNTGTTISIHDTFSRVFSEVEYSDAEPGMSYALTVEDQYTWTTTVTPHAPNQLTQAPVQEKSQPQKSSTTKKATPAASKTSSKQKTTTTAQVAIKPATAGVPESTSESSSETTPESETSASQKSRPWTRMIVALLGLGSAGAGFVAAKKYFIF